MKGLLGAVSALALAVGAAPAQAVLLDFTLVGPLTTSWQLESSPTPSNNGVTYFNLWDVTFAASSTGKADFGFYFGAVGGGLDIYDYYADQQIFVGGGDQLYTGPSNAPTFKTGTFVLTDTRFGFGTSTLTISEAVVAAPVPEPATWLMMIGGFGLVGAALRRRPRQTVSVRYS